MSKIVAPSIRNAEFQRIKDGDAAVLFFRDTCPYCKEFKPTWNRIAKELKTRWNRHSLVVSNGIGADISGDDSRRFSMSRDSNDDEKSITLDEDKLIGPPRVVKVDVTKFPAIKNRIRFPTVPCIALYKTDKPVVFITTNDRSCANVLPIIENYYRRNELPLSQEEYKIGNPDGSWPSEIAVSQAEDVGPPEMRIKEVPKKEDQREQIPLLGANGQKKSSSPQKIDDSSSKPKEWKKHKYHIDKRIKTGEDANELTAARLTMSRLEKGDNVEQDARNVDRDADKEKAKDEERRQREQHKAEKEQERRRHEQRKAEKERERRRHDQRKAEKEQKRRDEENKRVRASDDDDGNNHDERGKKSRLPDSNVERAVKEQRTRDVERLRTEKREKKKAEKTRASDKRERNKGIEGEEEASNDDDQGELKKPATGGALAQDIARRPSLFRASAPPSKGKAMSVQRGTSIKATENSRASTVQKVAEKKEDGVDATAKFLALLHKRRGEL